MLNKMALVTFHLSITALNINGLNSLNKDIECLSCYKTQNPTTCCLQETHLSFKNTQRMKCKW